MGKTVNLSDICELIVDCLHSTAYDQGHGYALIRTPNIGRGRFILEGVHRVSEKIYNERNKRAIPQNDDLIFAREAPAGNVAIIKNGEKMCLGQRTVLIRPNSKKVYPLFLCYYLLAPIQQHGLLSTANGATVGHVNMSAIRNLKICLPSSGTQQKIASILSAYDDLIENNRRRIQLLEEAARQLYKEWFVRLRFPGHEHVKVVDGVPEGWERKALNTICIEKRETIAPQKVNATTPYIGLEHMPRRSISLCNWGSAIEIESTKLVFKIGDILFGKIRSYFHKVGIAFVDGITSSDVVVLSPTEEKLRMYLLLNVSSDAFVAISAKTAKPGSKMPRADWKYLLTLPVLIPNDSTLLLFNSFLCPLVAQLKLLSLTNHKLAQSRDLLLPKLMSGEVAV